MTSRWKFPVTFALCEMVAFTDTNSLSHSHRISEYIPPRAPVPRREGGVQRAVTDYHKKTGEIASILLSEFRELFGEEVAKGPLSDTQEDVNERCACMYRE